ncbi:MAG: DUF362 domain-containing protein, partial [Bacteroidota bacterium]|nr:DUF362 domain-containing protein [Bacteroidota bacterium]
MKKYFSIQILLTLFLLAGIYGFSDYSLKIANRDAKNVSIAKAPKTDKNATAVKPVVYMTKDISPAGLMAIYKALGRKATGRVAVKISTGEPGGHNYLSPNLIKNLVQSVHGTIVECNTAYGGQRTTTAMHKQVAIDHGFTAIAPVD